MAHVRKTSEYWRGRHANGYLNLKLIALYANGGTYGIKSFSKQ
jgi:hypothetical protein